MHYIILMPTVSKLSHCLNKVSYSSPCNPHDPLVYIKNSVIYFQRHKTKQNTKYLLTTLKIRNEAFHIASKYWFDHVLIISWWKKWLNLTIFEIWLHNLWQKNWPLRTYLTRVILCNSRSLKQPDGERHVEVLSKMKSNIKC